MKKEFDIEVRSEIVSRPAPDLEEIKPRAVAGLTEDELIERHLIGTYEGEGKKEKKEKPAKAPSKSAEE